MTVEISGLHYFDSREEANQAMSHEISEHLNDALNNHNKASLWLSGGTTPSEMYNLLSDKEIDWEKVVISLVDERWVPPIDEASNERMIKEHMLKNKADAAEFLPFFQVTSSPEANRQILEEQLHNKVRGPLDVVVLGMGTDGHVASLFPCANEIEDVVSAENDHYTAVTHPKVAPHPRLTLTLNRLLASRNIYLLLFGEEKMKTLIKAEKEGDEMDMPIRYFLRNDQPQLKIFWAP
ncbi:6-phosphogluconolactonase [Pleionea sediminis]|uniref:6-phosphogluconolactonase n=1 Tax=Pleionea sediminis TaxID=2569479 RepID=UPI0011859D4E|nr:6-phosphogluconolactonase [Pleionea sediminis]